MTNKYHLNHIKLTATKGWSLVGTFVGVSEGLSERATFLDETKCVALPGLSIHYNVAKR